jgi:hypothetical protein
VKGVYKMFKFDWVITNGHADIKTIADKENEGWQWVISVPAKRFHPDALDTDWINIFTKYKTVEYKEYELPPIVWDED